MNIVSAGNDLFLRRGSSKRMICMSAFCIALFGCASGSGIKHKRLIDAREQDIGVVCVVPMYKKGGGVGFGPDAVGSKMLSESYLVGPYKFDSGNDILSGVVKNERRVIPIPPLISYGENLSYDRFLLLKQGYSPVLLLQHDIFSSGPVVFSESAGSETAEYIRFILEQNPKQAFLQAIFATQSHVRVEYNDADVTLLRSCVD